MPYTIDLCPLKQKMMKQMQMKMKVMKEATMKLKEGLDALD